MSAYQSLEERIGYTFQNPDLLRLALTHTSYANERGECGGKNCLHSNQRLEFLGDSVLSTVVSSYLYAHFPQMPEGQLSRLRAAVVCEAALVPVAHTLQLQQYLLLGHGEMQSGGAEKPSILADAVEALIAAVYLDSDYGTVEDVLLHRIGMDAIIRQASHEFGKTDYKTVLQEHFRNPDIRVRYRILDVQGPAHSCVYEACAEVLRAGTDVLYSGTGQGASKKEAEQQAAHCILRQLGVS